MNRQIRSCDDVLRMLDRLFAEDADRWTPNATGWWDRFYSDRSKPIPFFVAKPDESLVSYLERGILTPGRALDLGCGPGRNAVHLASAGFDVDAVDLPPVAVAWGEERARETGVDVRFHCADTFSVELPHDNYDRDDSSGCRAARPCMIRGRSWAPSTS